MKKIAILGSTGSIGTQTLEVARENGDIEVLGLAAGSNIRLLEEQIREFHPRLVAVWSEDKAQELRVKIADKDTKVVSGMEGLLDVSTMSGTEILVTAVVGMIGIRPTIEAINAGKDIALANKETLVTAGHLIMPLAKEKGVSILPVDSEHSAIFQSLQGNEQKAIHKILLTASGGPFRGRKAEELLEIKVEDALKHPNWSMGQKITIDSSTMINKGLEVIEASRLFDFSPDKVKVVVHPQSLVHSLVRTKDGMMYAQISDPDMRHPIYGALVSPEYKETYLNPFDLFDHEMTFFAPRIDDFPMLSLAYKCSQLNGSYTIAFNAANEIAVQAFIDKKCRFTEIPKIVSNTLQKDWSKTPDCIEMVYETDALVRIEAEKSLNIICGGK